MRTLRGGFVFGIWDLYWSLRVNDPFLGAALCPSKSGLMNKHIVKHIGDLFWVFAGSMYALYPSKSGLMNKHIVKQTYRVNVPCARLSPD